MQPRDRPRERTGTSDAERQILAATERLLETTPLTKLNVARILTEADIARTTFYFYYSSKYAPVVTLLAGVMDQIYERISLFTGPGEGDAGEVTLEKAMDGAAQLFSEHRMLFRATVEHWHSVPELGRLWLEVIERFTGAFASKIDAERAAGLAPPGPPSRELAAALIWASERILYIAGRGVDADLPNEGEALRALQVIWRATVYSRS